MKVVSVHAQLRDPDGNAVDLYANLPSQS